MSNKLKLGLFICALIFTLMLVNAPDRVGENHYLIDSLRSRAYRAERERDKYKEEARQKDILADTWFKEAERLRTSKTIYITKYRHDTVHINSLTPNQLDSAIQSIYPKK